MLAFWYALPDQLRDRLAFTWLGVVVGCLITHVGETVWNAVSALAERRRRK